MTSEANRAAENLLLLCIPHSYEVDDHHNRFSPDLLREWRAAQRSEHAELQQSWSLTDNQLDEVVEESFSSVAVSAPLLTAVVRAAERLCSRAEGSRSSVAVEAAAWRDTWERTRARSVGWDQDGDSVYADPPPADTARHRAAVFVQLAAVNETLAPLLEDLRTEIAAVRHSVPRSASWCRWLEDAGAATVAAASSWPGPPPAGDDERLVLACAETRRAVGALATVLRGGRGEEPPRPEEGAEARAPGSGNDAGEAAQDPFAAHTALLDRARRWHRVDHHPYDADVFRQLVEAAVDAATLWPVWDTMTFGLDVTSALAAAVARNASEEEFEVLLDQVADTRPLVSMTSLLLEMSHMLEAQGRSGLVAQARSRLVGELSDQDWADTRSWEGNDVLGVRMFQTWAALTSPDVPRRAIGRGLRSRPTLLREVVLSCASWKQRSSELEPGRRYVRTYRELPAWFPTDDVLLATRRQFPDLVAARDSYDYGTPDGGDELQHLLRRVLRLAASA